MAIAVACAIAYIARNFHSTSDRKSARGTPVHLSHGRASTRPTAPRRCSRTSICPSTPTPRSASSARTAPASRPCSRSWPAWTRSIPAKPGSPRARPSATWRRSRQLDPAQDRVRERHGRRRQEDRHHRSLQRADDELFRRDRRRVGQAAGRDGPAEPVGPRTAGRDGDGSAGLPAQGRRRRPTCRAASAAASRCASCCCASPTCCCSTSRPTISTPRPRRGWKSTCAHYPGAVMIITHDRYFLDNVTGWILELDRGRGIPYEGNYTAYLDAKAKRLQAGRPRGRRPPEGDLAASASGSRPARRRARPSRRRASRPIEDLVDAADKRRPTDTQIVIPHGERLGNVVIEVDELDKGFGDQLLIEDLDVQAAARRHRRRHRPERRRQDDAVPHDHRPGEARRRLDPRRRDGEARLCRPEPRRARSRTRPCGRKFPAAPRSSSSASTRPTRAPIARRSTSAAATSSRRSATSPAASATACIWPRC